MAGQGRHRVPTEVLLARGSRRGKERAKREPRATGGLPAMPSSLDKAERVVWRMLIYRLTKLGIASMADSFILKRYCEAIVERDECRAMVTEDGRTYDCGLNGRRLHPMYSRIGKLEDQLLRYDQELGLSPAARARLTVAPPKPKDDLGDFVKGKPDLKIAENA